MNTDSHQKAAVAKPSHEQISIRAQLLWNAEGCPEGRDEEIWLKAEKQLHDEAKEIIGNSDSDSSRSSSGASAGAGTQPQKTETPKSSPSVSSEQMSAPRRAAGGAAGGKRRASGR
jgi:Protein of unknown function (DUF2934)